MTLYYVNFLRKYLARCAMNHTASGGFKKKVVEAYWRQAVIKLLRESYA
ncbi:hypothetical protein MUN35_22185 [Hafnia paralvei]|nr:hypothetical protein [Hafnia paralvei]MCK2182382.1 hypothetical protein [Hafnia paralvei]